MKSLVLRDLPASRMLTASSLPALPYWRTVLCPPESVGGDYSGLEGARVVLSVLSPIVASLLSLGVVLPWLSTDDPACDEHWQTGLGERLLGLADLPQT